MEPTKHEVAHAATATDVPQARTRHAWEDAVIASGGARTRLNPSAVPIRIATTDARLASLYAGTLDARGRLHLAHLDSLRTPWERFHEFHRADELGRGPSANAAQRPASSGHEAEEMERRFARMVADWLHDARRAVPDEPLAVFAAPRFLGLLRDALGSLGDGIALYRGEFTGLRVNELAAHPTVRLLVQAMRAESRVTSGRAEVTR